jgi:CheY-like chemotaxis protein
MISDEINFLFDLFPTGLMVIKNKSEVDLTRKFEHGFNFSIFYMNEYAKSLLGFTTSATSDEIILSLKKFNRIESIESEGYSRCPTFCDYKQNLLSFINNSYENFNFKAQFICEKFISNDLLIYVKVKRYKDYKLISLDNLLEEKKSIEKNMMKNIKNQFFITISHELNNPLNSLVNIFEDSQYLTNNKEKIKTIVKTNVSLIKIFLKNLIVYFKIGTDILMNNKNENNFVNIGYLLKKVEKKYYNVFNSKNVKIKSIFNNLEDSVVNYDYEYFKLLIENTYIYFYHLQEKNQLITVELKNDANYSNSKKIVLIISLICDNTGFRSYRSNVADKSYMGTFDISSSVKTLEMIRDLIFTISTFLKIDFNIEEEDSLQLILDVYKETTSDGDLETEEIPEELSIRSSKNMNLTRVTSTDLVRRTISQKFNIFNLKNLPLSSDQKSDSDKKESSKASRKKNTSSQNLRDRENPKTKVLERAFTNSNSITNNYLGLEKKPPKTKKSNKRVGSSSSKEKTKESNSRNGKIIIPQIRIDYKKEDFSHLDAILENLENSFTNDNINNLNISNGGESSSVTDLDDVSHKESPINIPSSHGILIVDDQEFNLRVMKCLLKAHNLEAEVSMNGLECLDRVTKNVYKLILMDVMMPIMDGIEASEKIQTMIEKKEINYFPNIIIVSAHNVEDVINKTKKIKIVKEFIPKPVSKVKIKDILDKYYF